jgi:hypothetical protein
LLQVGRTYLSTSWRAKARYDDGETAEHPRDSFIV